MLFFQIISFTLTNNENKKYERIHVQILIILVKRAWVWFYIKTVEIKKAGAIYNSHNYNIFFYNFIFFVTVKFTIGHICLCY